MKIASGIFILITAMISQAKSNDTTLVLHYLVRSPKINTGKPPLLILLHGVGSNEEDLFSFADQLPEKYLIVSARAPNSLGGNSFAWYPVDFSSGKPSYIFEEEEKSRNTIIKFIDQLIVKYSVNNKEIYLCGFSQGAIMSYSVALTRPDLIKGVAIMSGRLLEEIKSVIATKDKLQHTKYFISHGTNDNTLGIHYAREAHDFLKTLNLNITYKEYQAAHEINNEMLNDLVLWLK